MASPKTGDEPFHQARSLARQARNATHLETFRVALLRAPDLTMAAGLISTVCPPPPVVVSCQ